jgi:DNA polymerase elongation subunit (family B)
MIQEGEKIKFVYLKMPNPIMENCISYFSEIPKEFGLDNYIDHNLQFDKSFLKPLENVLECIGWTSKKIVTLDRFFG